MTVGFKEIAGLVWTGLLGLLWYDIRNIRIERQEQDVKIEEKFLPRLEHELLCKNAHLTLQSEIQKAKDEIIGEIRINGQGCRGCPSNGESQGNTADDGT